ncbi:hypothetical protein Dsin_020577 [Dipteronia sinensis]|uniref:RING-type domain-containing protein n=1 Tax=Dipteronia sinensis TaxID=43782 RepID=A0AAE0E446_9ROSI|nr:hypothetical protein Dsin_020577 [Dipteronia sinensis]
MIIGMSESLMNLDGSHILLDHVTFISLHRIIIIELRWKLTSIFTHFSLLFLLAGVMTVLLLLSFRLCKPSSQTTTITDSFRIRAGDTGSARNPLLVHKDDNDLWSEASSSDSQSPDDEDLEGSSNKRICVICYDAPRDCFFLPCGHAASCYACATRIKEEHGLCPMCRKATKKVQRIFTV